MKKMIYTMIALLLMGALLAGCGKADPAETKDGTTETQSTTEGEDLTEKPRIPTPKSNRVKEDDLLAFKMLFSFDDWYIGALTSWYSCPENVDLYMLFHDGFQDEVVTSEEAKNIQTIMKEQKGEIAALMWTDECIIKNPKRRWTRC